jgi:hypothetical protein
MREASSSDFPAGLAPHVCPAAGESVNRFSTDIYSRGVHRRVKNAAASAYARARAFRCRQEPRPRSERYPDRNPRRSCRDRLILISGVPI